MYLNVTSEADITPSIAAFIPGGTSVAGAFQARIRFRDTESISTVVDIKLLVSSGGQGETASSQVCFDGLLQFCGLGERDNAVHEVGLDEGAADVAFAGLVGGHAAIGEDGESGK